LHRRRGKKFLSRRRSFLPLSSPAKNVEPAIILLRVAIARSAKRPIPNFAKGVTQMSAQLPSIGLNSNHCAA
jgi:hypothetical protein